MTPLLLALIACADPEDSGQGADDTGAPETADTGAPETGAAESGASWDTNMPADLAINELMADNTASWSPDGASWPDWIELYNPGAEDVDLLGWSLSDDPDQPALSVIPEALVVPAGGFLLLCADDAPELGAEHLGFKLSAEGDEVMLYTPDGRRADWVIFGAQRADVAAARVVDGDEEAGWAYVAGGSPGESNQGG